MCGKPCLQKTPQWGVRGPERWMRPCTAQVTQGAGTWRPPPLPAASEPHTGRGSYSPSFHSGGRDHGGRLAPRGCCSHAVQAGESGSCFGEHHWSSQSLGESPPFSKIWILWNNPWGASLRACTRTHARVHTRTHPCGQLRTRTW